MDRLPPATISIKRSVKRTASEADINNDDDGPTHLQIENKLGGYDGGARWIYVKKGFKRSNVHTPKSPSPDFAPQSASTSTIQTPILPHGPPASANPGPIEQPLPKLINEPQRFHLRHQPKPKSTKGFFTKISRTKDTQVLFESRKPGAAKPIRAESSQKYQGVWNVPVNSTPAPSISQAKLVAPSRNLRQVSGQVAVHDTHGEDFEEAMRKYTLDSIGASLQESAISQKSVPKPLPQLQQRASPSRFKPKAPALRYHERPGNENAQVPPTTIQEDDDVMVDIEAEEEQESFVIDEFVRMPIEQLGVYFDPTQNVGLLVLEAQEDLDVFYADDSDDESEIYDEEEDENAENHPSADYPEDEVDSDDEFGRNPYLYRNRNASDEEEFDEDEATYSDDDVVGTTKSWNKKPAWMRTKAEVDEEKEAEEWN